MLGCLGGRLGSDPSARGWSHWLPLPQPFPPILPPFPVPLSWHKPIIQGQCRDWVWLPQTHAHPHSGPANSQVSTNMPYGTFAAFLGRYKGLVSAYRICVGLHSYKGTRVQTGAVKSQELPVTNDMTCAQELLFHSGDVFDQITLRNASLSNHMY